MEELTVKTFTVKITVQADFNYWDGLYLDNVLSERDKTAGADVLDSEILSEETEE
jgi:hypothetical protein